MQRKAVLIRLPLSAVILGVLLKCLVSVAADPPPPLLPPASADPLPLPAQVVQQPATPEQTPPVPKTPAATQAPAVTPEQTAPQAPTAAPSAAGAGLSVAGLFGGAGGSAASAVSAAAPAQTNAITANPAAVAVGGGDQAFTRATTDAGDLLAKSLAGQGVSVQHRSPIITDPRIRGYYDGQLGVLANGAPFYPARADLDTVVSEIDSSNIQSIVVVKGPYSVRYGPGFAFLDVETLATPRYKCFEAHESTSVTYQTNGNQWNARQTIYGGESDWGFRLGYNWLQGWDYHAGGGQAVPSRYKQQSLDFAYGYDFSQDTHVEFKALRLRDHDVLVPGTLTDINALVTDAYTVRFSMDNQVLFDKSTLDAWYNYTHFNGDDLRATKRIYIPQLQQFVNQGDDNVAALNLETQGDSISRGFREAMTWGKAKEWQFTFGVDFTYLSTYVDEFDTFVGPAFPMPLSLNGSIPRAHLADPGIFLDSLLPVGDNLILKAGTRVDFATTQVQTPLKAPPDNVPPLSSYYTTDLGPNALDLRHFYLWSLYGTADYKLNDNWKLLAGCGFAEIPPTLTELYGDTPFLALNQNGFDFYVGNPSLKPPEDIQMDFGIKGEYERFRTGFSFYYAWIHNYITYEQFNMHQNLTQGSLPLSEFRFLNTELATLWGGEYYTEWDVLDWLTPFGTFMFTQGEDLTRNGLDDTYTRYTLSGPMFNGKLTSLFATRGGVNIPQEPLPGINPPEGRVGFRIHEPNRSPRWAIEFTTRIVAFQDNYAGSLGEVATPGFTTYNIAAYWQVNKHFLLTAGVLNFTDHKYREHVDLLTGYPLGPGVLEPGISFYFGTKLEY